MANQCRITQAAANAACNAIVDLIDAGDAGQLIVYAGAVPANCNAAAGTEVATITLNDPAFGDSAFDTDGGAAAIDADPALADASATGGTPAYFRLLTSAGTAVIQGTAGASECDLNITGLSGGAIGAGASLTVTALTVKVPINQA